MAVKVSIIIPVYNMEKYLHQCMDTVISQTLTEIEILAVDDCSKDNSLAILEEYAAKDSRVKVIEHERNRGAGGGRNSALAVAIGEYIGFVEPDDWCEPDMFEMLYDQAKRHGADISVCGFYKVLAERNVPLGWNFIANGADEAFVHFYEEHLAPMPWNKIYKHDLLNGFKYREEVAFEDYPAILFLLANVKRVVSLERCLYYYRQHDEASMGKNVNARTVYSRLKGIQDVSDFYAQYPQYAEVGAGQNRALCSMTLHAYLKYLSNLPKGGESNYYADKLYQEITSTEMFKDFLRESTREPEDLDFGHLELDTR